MNIAMFFQLRCLRTLQVWIRQVATGVATGNTTKTVAPHAYSTSAAAKYKPRALQKAAVTSYPLQPIKALRPLRIVQVRELGQRSDRVGRMVISGRMADVCAELDRLAAREASPS